MFYVTKILRGKPRHYLYEAYRDADTKKARRRMVAYCGDCRTVQERLRQTERELADLIKREKHAANQIEGCLKWLRRAGIRDSEIEDCEHMGAQLRRITFTTPESLKASLEIWPIRRRIARLLPMVERLRSVVAHPACPKSRA